MYGWVKRRSWHMAKSPTREANTYLTYCGKEATGEVRTTFEPTEKTCETCLRQSHTKLEEK